MGFYFFYWRSCEWETRLNWGRNHTCLNNWTSLPQSQSITTEPATEKRSNIKHVVKTSGYRLPLRALSIWISNRILVWRKYIHFGFMNMLMQALHSQITIFRVPPLLSSFVVPSAGVLLSNFYKGTAKVLCSGAHSRQATARKLC